MNGSPDPGEVYKDRPASQWKIEQDTMSTCETEPNYMIVQPLTHELKPELNLSSTNPSTFRPEHTLSTAAHTSIKSEPISSDEHIMTSNSSSDGCTSGGSSSSFNSAQHTMPQKIDHHTAQNNLSFRNTNKLQKDSVALNAVSSSVHVKNDHHNLSRITTMAHVKAKFMTELEYMLREFKKLERQLLGAKTGVNGVEDSSGSKERREKLHTFIIHLEDTIRQIETGCKHELERRQSKRGEKEIGLGHELKQQPTKIKEDDGSSTIMEVERVTSTSSSFTIDDQKHEEEVRKLEDHIRNNLLPVKVRLSKQLEAQLGANQNPVGMPVNRRGLQQSDVVEKGKGTFASAAEQKRLAQMKRHPQMESNVAPSSAPIISDHASARQLSTEDYSQFGKPLGSAGSSLTHKLHGETLGSESRPYGCGVGSKLVSSALIDPEETALRKMMVAGVAPGSDHTQIISSVSSVTSAHRNFFDNPQLDSIAQNGNILSSTLHPTSKPVASSTVLNQPCIVNNPLPVANPLNKTSTSKDSDQLCISMPKEIVVATRTRGDNDTMSKAALSIPTKEVCDNQNHFSMTIAPRSPKKSLSDPTLTLEERAEIIRRRLQKKKRRLLSEQQSCYEMDENSSFHLSQKQCLTEATDPLCQLPVHSKKSNKASIASRGGITNRNGPKAVEYICALCNETYASTCDSNPWWTLNTQECSKCLKIQIPRIDITSPANEIEYHPALLVQAAEDNNVTLSDATENLGLSYLNSTVDPLVTNAKVVVKMESNAFVGNEIKDESMDQDSASDLDFGPINGDDLSTSDSDSSSDFGENMSLAARAEHEEFGKEYSGPKFLDYDSSRLLVLMSHASTCPGLHKNVRARNVCRNIKLLMLHVRDCPGTTSCSDICPFPWCRKTKHLLYHLVSCSDPINCSICSRTDDSVNLKALKGLNDYRMKKRLIRPLISSFGEIESTKPLPIVTNQLIQRLPSSKTISQRKSMLDGSNQRSKPSAH